MAGAPKLAPGQGTEIKFLKNLFNKILKFFLQILFPGIKFLNLIPPQKRVTEYKSRMAGS